MEDLTFCAVYTFLCFTGFTHLACESVCVFMHLTMSPSHPVFRLIMRHFIYLLQINN